ncbi:MAG TPA: site-specific integrase, partial [Burkholderiaceae bacterium]|nr:site-specific integrase [Burkholderiaceae bacterium]
MEPAVDAFRDHLRSEKRASPHTVRAYLHDVGELSAFVQRLVGRAVALGDLDAIACRSYLASLHGHNDAVTIGRKLSSLRAFFRFLVRRRMVA